ncbi:pseudouridylate synthase PUS7L isoform X2 [Denticeps clupeoides]|uniref:Pseudouridylate synthase PUS7L n=1 Tax=Denticeps clupeoides TaxID=299321 RepID=A0AAY4ENC7_9TELE|nr:pseudouridylate synthase 7 homolog-like protein isoform X2 [Denticeps clupeoides]
MAFVSKHSGFLGSIKNDVRDFVVTEIDIHGRLVTHQPADGSPTGRQIAGTSPPSPGRPDPGPVPRDPADLDLGVVLGPDVCEKLESFSKDRGGERLSLGMFPDRQHRAGVHRAVRHNYPFLVTLTDQTEILVKEDLDFRQLAGLVSEAESEEFFRFIDAKLPGSVFTFRPDGSKEHRTLVHHFLSRRFGKLVETKSFSEQQKTSITVRIRGRGKPGRKRAAEDSEDLAYTAFTLQKENLETLHAISHMSASLGVLPSDFTYAGIKDKRAITYQSMVVKKVSLRRLKEKAAEFEKQGMILSNIRSVSEPLRLGRLRGNHFDIVVRELRPRGECSHDRLEKLVHEAMENTKVWGFVNYYGPQRFGSSQSVQADRVGLALLKEEMNAAVRLFFTPEEGCDLQNEAKRHFLNTGNAKESLALMPWYKARERLMLRALHRYGAGPEGCAQAWLSLPHGMRVFYPHAYCSRVWNEAAAHRLQTLGLRPVQGDLVWAGPAEREEENGGIGSAQVRVVSAAEEEENVFKLEQVVLPMPGNSILYPENKMAEWYKDRLAQDGLQSCRFRVTPLKLNVPGCYRPLLAHARNLTYALHERKATEDSNDQSDLCNPPSLSLSFDLDASCYATVFLREVMKCDL